LPAYEILDQILEAYIEADRSKEEIITMGFEEPVVSEIIRKVDHNEYKRQQAPIGIKITPKAFGSGRRMPIR
jgi:NAD+ synthase (glutamine-hydrolysing)